MQNRDWRRPFRYLWRLPLLLLHVTLGLAITVMLPGPIGRALRWRGEPVDQWVLRTWSRLVIRWLASRGGTIYHHRGDNESLHGVMHQMLERLQRGEAVGVFPEGRTCD